MRCVRLFFPSLEYESSHTTSAAAALMLSLDLVASFSLSAAFSPPCVARLELRRASTRPQERRRLLRESVHKSAVLRKTLVAVDD